MSERVVDELLADLARHPGWQVLADRVHAYQEQDAVALRDKLIREREPLDQLALARARGFWAGQRWILRAASNELAAFNRQDDKAREKQPTT